MCENSSSNFKTSAFLRGWNKLPFGSVETVQGKIMEALSVNSRTQFWRDFKDMPEAGEFFEATDEIQDIMEDIVRRVYECFLKIRNRFLVSNYTDSGPGDICWINP